MIWEGIRFDGVRCLVCCVGMSAHKNTCAYSTLPYLGYAEEGSFSYKTALVAIHQPSLKSMSKEKDQVTERLALIEH
jgi:hypothetical protein